MFFSANLSLSLLSFSSSATEGWLLPPQTLGTCWVDMCVCVCLHHIPPHLPMDPVECVIVALVALVGSYPTFAALWAEPSEPRSGTKEKKKKRSPCFEPQDRRRSQKFPLNVIFGEVVFSHQLDVRGRWVPRTFVFTPESVIKAALCTLWRAWTDYKLLVNLKRVLFFSQLPAKTAH